MTSIWSVVAGAGREVAYLRDGIFAWSILRCMVMVAF